jgi:hypothetical protein
MSRRTKIFDLSVDRALGRSRRGIAAWLGGLLILLNVLAAGVGGASAHSASSIADGLSGDRIVICAGDGMVVVDRSGRPVEDRRSGEKVLCAFCLPLMQGHAKAPDPIVGAPAPAERTVVVTRRHQVARPAPAALVCASRPRAPPLL